MVGSVRIHTGSVFKVVFPKSLHGKVIGVELVEIVDFGAAVVGG